MSNLIYDLTLVPMLRTLRNLDAIVDKAEELLIADDKIKAETLLQARLYPNMLPFIVQIRIATDTAKGAAARGSGGEVPSWPDDEKSFADVHERLRKAIDFLAGFTSEHFAAAESRQIEFKLGPRAVSFIGTNYIAEFVLPNFYFHVTTAYDILRHNGVEVGKQDYLGEI